MKPEEYIKHVRTDAKWNGSSFTKTITFSIDAEPTEEYAAVYRDAVRHIEEYLQIPHKSYADLHVRYYSVQFGNMPSWEFEFTTSSQIEERF